jgi:hypothetical protein
LQLSEHLSHIFHFIPDLEAHENGSELLSRHGDTITRPRSDLDDLLLSRFVLRALGKSRKTGAVFRSLTTALSIFVPSARNTFANRSWVSGRSFCLPCMNIVTAAPTL